MMEEIRTTVSIERLGLIHLNDSLKEFGSHRDRHASIGKGKIWNSSFKSLVRLLEYMTEFAIPSVCETHSPDDVGLLQALWERKSEFTG